MIFSRESISRAERSLGFDPRAVRRVLLERTPVADLDHDAVQRRLAQVLGEGREVADLAVDRVLTGADQLDLSFLERGVIAADAVARIDVRAADGRPIGYGTGFLVSPRLLMTTAQILPTVEIANESWADFGYQFDARGHKREPTTFAIDPARFFFVDPALDVTVVAVAERALDRSSEVTRFGWLRPTPSEDTVLRGEWVSIVHHPNGRPKQVALRQNLLLELSPGEIWYTSSGAPGSSGAPVFNDSWQVVAMHRGGAPARDANGEILTVDGARWTADTDESRIVWRANVGARMSAVIQRLAERHAGEPLVDEMVRDGRVEAAEAIVVHREPIPSRAAPEPAAGAVAAPRNGVPHDGAPAPATTTVTVPLRVTLRTGDGVGPGGAVQIDVR